MSTNTKYQIAFRAGRVFRLPVLPETISVTYGTKNDSINVYGIGEVTIIQSRQAAIIEFSSFFPAKYFSGCNYSNIPKPSQAKQTIVNMQKAKKPIRLTVSGSLKVSMYVTIESFDVYEQGGDVGTLYYTIRLKEYREVKIRQMVVNTETKEASPEVTTSRTDNTPQPRTYTVKHGDCLWNIAKKIYGSGEQFTKIYEANRSVIGSNPNRIKAGQVYTIPA